MVRAARAQRVFLMEAMWTRFLPAIAAVRSIVAARTLGRLRLVTGGGGFIPAFDPQSPLFNPHLGGGVLLDAGVYLVSLASMLLGPPSVVLAQGELGPSGVDEQEAILLRCADGALAALYVSLQARRAPDLEILGSAGRLHIGAPVFRPTRLTLTVGRSACGGERAPGRRLRVRVAASGGHGGAAPGALRECRHAAGRDAHRDADAGLDPRILGAQVSAGVGEGT